MVKIGAVKIIRCPFCGGGDCLHFIGYTNNDGRTLERGGKSPWADLTIRDTDKIVTTGASARVYRKQD